MKNVRYLPGDLLASNPQFGRNVHLIVSCSLNMTHMLITVVPSNDGPVIRYYPDVKAATFVHGKFKKVVSVLDIKDGP